MKVLADKKSQCQVETIAYLHQVWEIHERGGMIQPDPFYERNDVLTEEVVQNVIRNIEDLFITELKKFPTYHKNQNNISESETLVPPGFDKMTPTEQRAVVQGIDRIFQQYRDDSDQTPAQQPASTYDPIVEYGYC